FEMLFVLKFRKVLTLRGTLILISFSVLPLTLAITMQFWWYPTPEYLSLTLSLIMIYVLFHGETTRQLAEKKLQLAQQETQLTESRISIMLSQIQPHFMYNMLTTIMYLCRTDPEEAEKTVGKFSRYLRANMDSLTLKQCIPFEKEMNHVKTYLSLEKKRFGDKLRVELDINEKDFMLPSLTIQPIIENAVKYGMRKKKELKILLKTYSDNDNYYIEIIDNGRGFDVNEVKNDGKSHIGIENVKNRLHMMCGGDLTIDSVPETGTTAVINIPKSKR
ncbi:MAG: histidine kinase, partial [Clostridiales bacterium]|nr:histidine kinase [Clostridiales bacterium]